MDDVLNWFRDDDRFDAGTAVHIDTFEVRRDKYPVRVEVRDYGSDAGRGQYEVYAYSPHVAEERRVINSYGESLGHTEPSVADALMGVHWDAFKMDRL